MTKEIDILVDEGSCPETRERVATFEDYTVRALAKRADSRHTAIVKSARKMLTDAYESGVALLMLQKRAQKAGESFRVKDSDLIVGTSIKKSTAYKYMKLARYWHMLPEMKDDDVLSITKALDHIDTERKALAAPESFGDLEDKDTFGPDTTVTIDNESGEVVQQEEATPSTRRRSSTIRNKIQRRITRVCDSTRQEMFEEPNEAMRGLTQGILTLQSLQAELQEHLDEEITHATQH